MTSQSSAQRPAVPPHKKDATGGRARSPWPGLSRAETFFEDAALAALMARAMAYVQAGICLHLSGPAGLGKTTMALRIADALERPVAFMTGNQWLGAADFIGRDVGKTTRTVVDNYIQSVHRTDSEERVNWRESLLAEAMRGGHVLVYDEFTRASPEANAVLLSVLEEGVLVSTDRAAKRSVIEAHPDFRIILTSNPHDYVGVSRASDALFDRMVTLPMVEPSAETIRGILTLRTGLDATLAAQVVARVASTPSEGSRLRAALMIGRIVAHMVRSKTFSPEMFDQVAADVLQSHRRDADGATPRAPMPLVRHKAAS